ncbi:MAG: TIGR01244 family phosphatase [Rhodobacteraceae bacterium]|nr:TIGR01244 family phosphatase [Paracoccaceae bacterium]
MDIRPINDTVGVTGQIQPEDLAALAARGFKSVVCNRPDGEDAAQPAFAEIETAAKAAGLEIRYIPVTHAGITEEQVSAFRAALDDMPKPLLAFCRSGARSASLHAATRGA